MPAPEGREHAEFFDRDNVARVERTQADRRCQRGQRTRPPTMSHRLLGRAFQAVFATGIFVVVDDMNRTGEAEDIDDCRHRHQDRVDGAHPRLRHAQAKHLNRTIIEDDRQAHARR